MKRLKRTFSLIEVVVCLGLFAFLLQALFFWYHNFCSQKEKLNQLKKPIKEERYAFQTLHQILPTSKAPFFTSDGCLIFRMNRGPYLEPLLSETVLAKLYHDRDASRLCLGIWPDPKKHGLLKTPSQTIVLLEGVSRLEFSFYFPPSPSKKPVNPENVGKPRPKTGWQENWQGEYQALPALVKIELTRAAASSLKKRDVEIIFDLYAPITFVNDLLAT